MTAGPEDFTAYEAAHLDLVRRTCRTVASRLGDMADRIVVVGGLVPSLLIDQAPIPQAERHIGTRDLDHMGPRYAARFMQREAEAVYRADVRGFVQELLRLLGTGR